MNIESLLQTGYSNKLAINKTKSLTQQLEVKSDAFMAIIFITISIFLIIIIILSRHQLKFKG